VKAGEVWSCGHEGDPCPWYYLVLEADGDGVDLALLDSDGEPNCVPGDLVELSWEDIEGDRRDGTLRWSLVAG